MFEHNKKVAPQETLVGWFDTGNEITSHSALIHDYYARETKDPIHLTVDTTLNSGKLSLKAYVFIPIGVPDGTAGSMFTPVPTEIAADETEVTALDLLHKTKFTKLRQVEPSPDLARVSEGVTKLELMLDAVIKYVEGVLSGEEKPDNAVGRKLLDLVNSVPKMSPDEFDKMVNSNMKVSKVPIVALNDPFFVAGPLDGGLLDAADEDAAAIAREVERGVSQPVERVPEVVAS